MPELPEVETARARLNKALVGRRITKVVVDKEDFVCFDQDEPTAVARALKGAKVIGTGRKGKYLWLNLDRKHSVLLHFGMTGNIEIRRRNKKKELDGEWGWGGIALWNTQANQLQSHKPPRFCRLFLELEDGVQVALTDPRRFGRIRLSEDPAHAPSIVRLGFDPLYDFPSAKKLGEKLARKRIAVKAALLDQAIFAGVGNWIADEILYQAGINPHRLTCDLASAEITRLRAKLLAIIRHSVKLEADYGLYPKNWLFHYRWGKAKNAVDGRGREILFETIGGRTTAWVPAAQS
jgi:formamidopyrimidine-DNA glycosylase